jgi:roadblock/LC7 domain-containing protein
LLASIAAFIAAHTMVRQQQAQAITPLPAAVHIGTEAFAVAGTDEWHVLTWIKNADCDPVVG